MIVILDNGHGENTPGKRSPQGLLTGPEQVALYEYEYNRDIVNRLIRMLDSDGIDFWELVPEVKDISLEAMEEPVADIAVMLGVLNWNLKNEEKNYTFSKQLIGNAFSAVKECLVVDFLSTQLTDSYPKEDFVFYHNPMTMLAFAFSLTNNVVLKQNYAAIPQKEFMLFLYKAN